MARAEWDLIRVGGGCEREGQGRTGAWDGAPPRSDQTGAKARAHLPGIGNSQKGSTLNGTCNSGGAGAASF